MKLIENAKSLVILVITAIVLCGLGYYKFIYQPDKLKQTVRDQSTAINTVQKSNDVLKEGIQFTKDAETLKEEIVEKGEQVKADNAAKKAEDHVKMETKVETIKADYDKQIEKTVDPEKTAELIKARQKAISKTRIDSLWTNYCQSEPSDPDCRGYK